MRGEIQSEMGLPQAVALLDLSLAGVHAEMSETMFDWLAVAAPVAPRAGNVVEMQAAVVPAALSPRPAAMAQVTLPQVKEAPVALVPVEEPVAIWREGEPGGVLLVVQGRMPNDRCVTLAKAMLLAAGVHDLPLGWVGYSGKPEAAALMAAMREQAPQQVLVLGQAPLGALLGRNLGVEGWHAAGGQGITGWDSAPVGVTYPLDLLMKQPLFKRLAWQHLLAWGQNA